MPLLVGLGNPGPQYDGTRHNVGFALIETLGKKLAAPDWKPWGKSLLCRVSLGDQSLLLAKPQTFMNLSGEAVQALMAFYKILPQDCAIIADDITLPTGSVRIRSNGGHGGHNGLRDILGHIGEGFPRIRIGVGPSPPHQDLSSFVLGKMGDTDWEALKPVFADFPALVETGLIRGWEYAGSRFNRRVDPPR